MKTKGDFYEMQIHKSEFTPLTIDESFRIEPQVYKCICMGLGYF